VGVGGWGVGDGACHLLIDVSINNQGGAVGAHSLVLNRQIWTFT
jgi:hypothetical protein